MTLISRIDIRAEHIDIRLCRNRLHNLLKARSLKSLPTSTPATDPGDVLKLKVKVRLQRVGREMKLVVQNTDDQAAADLGLLRIVARAHDFQERLLQHPNLTVPGIASQERLTIGYISSPPAASLTGTRYCHRHRRRQTPSSTQRKATDAALSQTSHRLDRSKKVSRVQRRITARQSAPHPRCFVLPASECSTPKRPRRILAPPRTRTRRKIISTAANEFRGVERRRELATSLTVARKTNKNSISITYGGCAGRHQRTPLHGSNSLIYGKVQGKSGPIGMPASTWRRFSICKSTGKGQISLRRGTGNCSDQTSARVAGKRRTGAGKEPRGSVGSNPGPATGLICSYESCLRWWFIVPRRSPPRHSGLENGCTGNRTVGWNPLRHIFDYEPSVKRIYPACPTKRPTPTRHLLQATAVARRLAIKTYLEAELQG